MNKSLHFDSLVSLCGQTHEALQRQAARSVNIGLVVRNWLFGWYIVEYQQRKQIRPTPSVESDNLLECNALKIGPTVSDEFNKIRQTMSGELDQISQTLSAQSFSQLMGAFSPMSRSANLKNGFQRDLIVGRQWLTKETLPPSCPLKGRRERLAAMRGRPKATQRFQPFQPYKRARRARSTQPPVFPTLGSRLSLHPCFFPMLGKIERIFSNAWKQAACPPQPWRRRKPAPLLFSNVWTTALNSLCAESKIKKQLAGVRYE
jgi:hypothetical protein